jgi:hypothetical protein
MSIPKKFAKTVFIEKGSLILDTYYARIIQCSVISH